MMTKTAACAALALVLVYGIAEGVWTNRWQRSGTRERAAARLASVPLAVGDWQGEAQAENPRLLRILEIDGLLDRRYVRQPGGESVRVLIVCGPPGPVAVHPPEVCFAGVGYQPAGDRSRTSVPGMPAAADFWAVPMQKVDGVLTERLKVLYAWGDSGDWVAADNPRWQFARSPVLFKLYVIHRPGAEEASGDDPAARFLEQFLPALHRSLFASAE
jgi:hypothetical protein